MRHINRQARAPAPPILQSDEAQSLRAEMRAYLESGEKGARQRRAPFRRDLLTGETMLAALGTLTEGRCAYCETALAPLTAAHVHLHRPPGFAADEDGTTDMMHYVWLAYEWENILPVCETCASQKANAFPVARRRAPPLTALSLIDAAEEPLLLDPCRDRPEEHLSFNLNGWVEATTRRGAATIDVLALNRAELVAARRAANERLGTAIFGEGSHPSTSHYPDEAAVFSSLEGRDIPHPAATTMALLAFADHSFGGTGSDLLALPAEIRRLHPETRNARFGAFVKELREEVATPAFDAAPAPPATRRRSRIPDLADLPFATSPLSRVEIRNFKALREIAFTLPAATGDEARTPCMLILGENATGKSSVLEAIALALAGTEETRALDRLIPDETIAPADMLHRPDPEAWDVTTDEPLSVTISYAGQSARTELIGRRGDTAFDGSPGSSKLVLAYGPRRYFSRRATRRFRAPAYRLTTLFDPIATIANPADWLLKVSEPTFDIAARALREVLMLDRSAHFAREDGRIIIETDSGRTPLSEMSVGYKSVVAMATDITREMLYHYDNLEYAAAIVLVDEIETHLHPRWKMRIMTLLRRAFPRIQFIVTTHDPLCLKGMYDGEVFVLQRSPDDSRVETLTDLPDPQGMRAEQILTSEFFGLGTTDPDTDAKLARYHALMRDEGALGPVEAEELARLRRELGRTMMLGDTLIEQAVTESLRRRAADPVQPPARMKNPDRKALATDLFARFGPRPRGGR